MAYIDDFYSTPRDEQERLQQKCEHAGCGHNRYLHGTTREDRTGPYRMIGHTPGKCVNCRCEVFEDGKSLTRDDVLDVAEGLAGAIRLAAFGITGVECAQPITRFYENGTLELKCKRPVGHDGAHDADARE